MKKITIILITILLVLSCKLLDKVEEQKADLIIILDYSQTDNYAKLEKHKSEVLNVSSIDEASIVIFMIDYSYSSISNYQVDTNNQSDADNWTGYWIPYVQGQLNDISSNKCTLEESSNLSISGNSATGQFTLEPGVYNILVGLFESNDLKYVGASNIIDLRAGDSETVNILVDPINTAPTASFTVSPTSGTTATTFTFDASGSTDNEDATSSLQVRWDWNNNGSYDTNWSTDKTESHQFSTSITHTVKLLVKDTGGLEDTYTKTVSVGPAVIIVTFPDANFEALIRETLNMPIGEITTTDLETITELDGSERNISNISGIEHCKNLIRLWLHPNQISDISALSGLTNLELLNLSDNQISNIYPLVQNNGINSGDQVYLQNNPLNYISITTYIPQLEALGVTVNYTAIQENITCSVCHSEDNLEMKRAEFDMSQHSVGDIAVAYAGSRASCAKCHSHEGFVQFAQGLDAIDFTNPSAWKCSTCHGLHQDPEATDSAVRLTDPIVPLFNSGITLDLNGNSNLCANCHQSRRAEPNVTNPGEDTFTISSTHYGPHQSTQANVVWGAGFAEIGGPYAYPSVGSVYHLNASCTGCHMSDFNGIAGGHSFIPSLDACNTCHATADFDYGNIQTEVNNLLIELRDLLVTAGVVENNIDLGYIPVIGDHSMIHARAFFNWIGIKDDRSLGVHNPRYVSVLLKNSIHAIE